MRASLGRGGSCLALVAALAACSGDDAGDATPATTGVVADEGRVVVCLEPAHRPFTNPDEAAPGGVEGLDVAVLEAVADLLELEVVLRPEADVQVLDEVAAGRCDLAAGGLVGPAASADVVTRPYADGGLLLVVREASARRLGDVDDLGGRNVAVASGSPAHRWALGELVGEVLLVTTDSTAAALDAVEDRSADAAVVDRFAAAAALPARPGLAVVATLAAAPGPVFVARTPGLRQDVDDALDRLDGTGRLDELAALLAVPLPAGTG